MGLLDVNVIWVIQQSSLRSLETLGRENASMNGEEQRCGVRQALYESSLPIHPFSRSPLTTLYPWNLLIVRGLLDVPRGVWIDLLREATPHPQFVWDNLLIWQITNHAITMLALAITSAEDRFTVGNYSVWNLLGTCMIYIRQSPEWQYFLQIPSYRFTMKSGQNARRRDQYLEEKPYRQLQYQHHISWTNVSAPGDTVYCKPRIATPNEV